MKKIALIILLVLTSCASAKLVDSWKNPEIGIYDPYKVFVVGLTSDEAAKSEFENMLAIELRHRGSEVTMSHDVLDLSSGTNNTIESELESLENKLIEEGFDTIILTKVVNIENKKSSLLEPKSYQETYQKFRDDYLMYHESYYNTDNYDNYTIYNVETLIYCICPSKARQLIWKGNINMTDPRGIKKTVKKYVRLVIGALEDSRVIHKIQ